MKIAQLDVTKKAMLAAIHFSTWSARKHDKKASREVAANNNASEDAGRFNKYLLKNSEKFDAIKTVETRIRQYFYKITLPWSDDGQRILSSDFYFEFMEKMREFAEEFRMAVNEFLDMYETYIEENRARLGNMHQRSEYPTIAKLQERYAFTFEVLPMPVGQDFRVNLSEEEQARIAQDIDRNSREKLQNGIQDLWFRLHKVVAKMAETLAVPDKGFHKTLVTNIEDLVEILPQLNITDDSNLTSLTNQVKTQLCQYTAEMLKNDAVTRQQTAQHATNIANTIAGVLDIPKMEAPSPVVVMPKPAPVDDTLTLPFAQTPAREEEAVAAATDNIFDRMAAYMLPAA
jgi:hypothetical protein